MSEAWLSPRGDRVLGVGLGHRPGADLTVERVLQVVLPMGAPGVGPRLGPEVGHGAGPAELQWDEVVELVIGERCSDVVRGDPFALSQLWSADLRDGDRPPLRPGALSRQRDGEGAPRLLSAAKARAAVSRGLEEAMELGPVRGLEALHEVRVTVAA